MLPNIERAVRFSLCSVLLASGVGCGPPSTKETLPIATGMDVTLVFTAGGTCSSEQGVICTEREPVEIEIVEVDEEGVFTVLDEQVVPSASGSEIHVRVRADRAGQSVLRINYRDGFGEEWGERFTLDAHALTNVLAGVRCDAPLGEDEVLPVPTATELTVAPKGFSGTPFSGGVELITGDTPLVDFGDFTVTEADNGRVVVVAPTSAGSYRWTTVVGAIDFAVFNPDDLDLALSAPTGEEILVQRVLGDTQVCIAGPPVRAQIEAVGGSCALWSGRFEVAGALPIELLAEQRIGVAGSGACTVAISAGEEVTSTDVMVDYAHGEEPGSNATPLTETPTQIHDGLPNAGSCSFADPDDEVVAAQWDVSLTGFDDNDEQATSTAVGVGLVSQMVVRVHRELDNSVMDTWPADALEVQSIPINTMSVAPDGCTGGGRAVELRPTAADTYNLSLFSPTAQNTYFDVVLEARDVTHSALRIAGLDESMQPPVGQASSVQFFTRNRMRASLHYFAEAAPLVGTGPILARTADTASLSSVGTDASLFTGDAPHMIEISSPVSPTLHTIEIVDASAVTQVTEFVGGIIEVGAEHCLTASAASDTGTIFGVPADLAELSVSGQSVAFSGGGNDDALCLRGMEPGSTEVTVTWGAASLTETIVVQ